MAQKLSLGREIKVDLYSRPNAMNGKYRAAQIGLDNLVGIKDADVFFLETLKMRADLADKMIADAEREGKDTSDLSVLRELGKAIVDSGEPVHRSESVMTAALVSLRIVAYYAIAIGIWGLIFKKEFLMFGFYGAVVGFIIALFFVAPIIARQRTREQIKDIVFAAGALWGSFGIGIGVVGGLVLIGKLVFSQ